MNPQIIELITAYRSGEIPANVFLQRMNTMGLDASAATKMMIDYDVGVKQGMIEPPRQPQVRTESGTMVTPGYSVEPRFQLKDPEGQTTPTAPYQVQQFAESGSPYMGSPYDQAGNAQRFRPQYDPGQAQRFRPMPELGQEQRFNPDGRAVQEAIALAKQRSAANVAAGEGAPQRAPQSDALQSLIRGRFGEAAKGAPMEDRLTAAQEARDRSGDSRASGGAVNNKEAALHKALEIIHHLIRVR